MSVNNFLVSKGYFHPSFVHENMKQISSAPILTILFLISVLPISNTIAQSPSEQYPGDGGSESALYILISNSPAVAIPGNSLDITAEITNLDDQEVLFDMWVKDGENQRWFERNNQTVNSNDKMNWDWSVSSTTPTGTYSICIGYWLSDYWSWDQGYTYTENCETFEVKLYKLSVIAKEPLFLPGTTVTFDGLVSHPWTGEPLTPNTLEWQASYYIEEGTNGMEERLQNGEILNPKGTFSFTVNLPLNVNSDVTLRVWANDTSNAGNQYNSMVSIGDYEILWSSIPSTLITEPIQISASTVISGSSGWFGHQVQPIANQVLDLSIEQDGESQSIASLTSDYHGHVSTLVDLSEIAGIHSGSADLILTGSKPHNGDAVNSSIPIWIVSDQVISGQGLQMSAKVRGGPFQSGDIAYVDIVVTDDDFQPMTNGWIHWMAKDNPNDFNIQSTIYSQEAVQLNELGKTTISVTVPTGFKGELSQIGIYIAAFNSTGYSDSASLNIPLNTASVNVIADRSTFSPGDELTFLMVADNFDSDIYWRWTTSDGQTGSLEGAGVSTSVKVTVSETNGDNSFQFEAVAIDGSGNSISKATTLYLSSGYMVNVELPNGRVKAGEAFTVDYEIKKVDGDSLIEFPLTWETSILGSSESTRRGIVTSETGELTVQPSNNLDVGTYIIVVTLGQSSTYRVIEIVDEDSIEPFTVASDVASSVSPALSIVSLVVAIIAIVLGLRTRKSNEDSYDTGYDNFSSPPPMPNLPPPAQEKPPLDLRGSVDHNGYEWADFRGQKWYRLQPNSPWTLWEN